MSNPTVMSAGGAVVETDPAQRSTAMIAHLLGIIMLLGPVIFYLIKKNDTTVGPFAKDQMKEVLNWTITVTIAMVAVYIVMFVALFISGILAMLISLLAMVLGIGNLVLVIVNAMKANKGIAARYPFKLAIVK